MPLIPLELADRARSQFGLLTVDDFLAAGLTSRQRRRMMLEGDVVRVHNGVVRLRSHELTHDARCAAACLAQPEIFLSEVTAGEQIGFRRLPRLSKLTAVTTSAGHIRLAGVRVRRTVALAAADVVAGDGGTRFTSPLRTTFDLARWCSDSAWESIVEHGLDEHLYCADELFAAAERWVRPGRAGSARVEKVLAIRGPTRNAAQSDLELSVLNALRERGIDLERQFEIRLRGGTPVHPDGADPVIRWLMEVDHHHWHDRAQARRYDAWRDRELRKLGWEPVRVGDDALAHDFVDCIDDLERRYRHHAAQVRPAS